MNIGVITAQVNIAQKRMTNLAYVLARYLNDGGRCPETGDSAPVRRSAALSP